MQVEVEEMRKFKELYKRFGDYVFASASDSAKQDQVSSGAMTRH